MNSCSCNSFWKVAGWRQKVEGLEEKEKQEEEIRGYDEVQYIDLHESPRKEMMDDHEVAHDYQARTWQKNGLRIHKDW